MDKHAEKSVDDFEHWLSKTLVSIKVGVWILVLLEFGKYFLW